MLTSDNPHAKTNQHFLMLHKYFYSNILKYFYSKSEHKEYSYKQNTNYEAYEIFGKLQVLQRNH